MKVGTVTWHCSDEDGGPDVGKSIAMPDGSELWFGEITRQRWRDTGGEKMTLGKDDSGWWIIHYRKGAEANVLGRCPLGISDFDHIEHLADALRTGKAQP